MSGQLITTQVRPPAVRRDWVRWILLATWIALAVPTVLLGERHGDLAGLERDLATGRVSEVSVSGAGLPDGAGGTVRQEIHWRAGLARRTVTVVSHSRGEDPGRLDGATSLGTQDAVTYLRGRAPGATVHQVSERRSGSSYLGWDNLPTWFGLGFLVVTLGTLIRIISTPRQPWRATRWAWFWIWTTPFGPPLYLLLSGPVPSLPDPRNPARRLTGGWAFLIFGFLIGSLT